MIAAADLLESDWGVLSDVWSVTSFSELRRDGIEAERYNDAAPRRDAARVSYVEQQLSGRRGPVIASTDYIRAVPDQIRQWVDRAGLSYRVLGTDGYGRSDYRRALRRFFEVDRYYVTVAALSELAAAGKLKPSVVAEAIAKYGIDVDAPMPTTV